MVVNKKVSMKKPKNIVKYDIKDNVHLTILLVIVVLVVLVVFIVKPNIESAYRKKDELDQKKLQLQSMQKDAIKAREFSNLVAGLKAEAEVFEKAIIKRDSMVSFFKELELISERAGNKISISHLEVTEQMKKAIDPNLTNVERAREEALLKNTIRLLITVEGGYQQFLEFFYKVNNMPYVFDVGSVEIKNARQANVMLDEGENKAKYTRAEITISFIVD